MTDIKEVIEGKRPELLRYLDKPFYRTMDGVKNGNHVWLFKASYEHETEFVELGNFALNCISTLTAQQERIEELEGTLRGVTLAYAKPRGNSLNSEGLQDQRNRTDAIAIAVAQAHQTLKGKS